MRTLIYRTSIAAALSAAALCHGQTPQRIAARATPGDYQAHAQAGSVTIAADFDGHSVSTPDAVFSSEEYVSFEVAFFGPAGSKLILNPNDFKLRIKGKKTPLDAQPYALVFHGLKDPDWEQSVVLEKQASQSKTSIGGGGGGNNDGPPPQPKMPIGVERKMEQRVEKAALPEGDRPLPEAGLIFFQYRGKTSSMQTLELVYTGAAGKATLSLQP
jgi:hypothetical protein